MQNKRIEITATRKFQIRLVLRIDGHSRMIASFAKEVSKVESVRPTWQTGG